MGVCSNLISQSAINKAVYGYIPSIQPVISARYTDMRKNFPVTLSTSFIYKNGSLTPTTTKHKCSLWIVAHKILVVTTISKENYSCRPPSDYTTSHTEEVIWFSN